LAILGVLARANPVLDSHATGKFAQAAKTFNYNNTKVTRSAGFETLPYTFAFFAFFAVRLFLLLRVRLCGKPFLVIKNRQIGASICHGFGARNLKYTTQRSQHFLDIPIISC